jgi:RNA polymerase sigma-70 factor (ECF subfamily)
LQGAAALATGRQPRCDGRLMGRLLVLFAAARPPATAVADEAASEAASEGALASALASARATWPAIELDDATMVAALADKSGDEGLAALPALLVADLYLAAACAAGVLEALVAFERHLQAARPALRRVDASDVFGDEVLQLVREKLLVWAGGPPKITSYAGRGPLASWTRVAVVRAALNHKRGAAPAPPLADDAAIVGGDGEGVELGYLKSHHRGAFQAAFEAAMASLSPAERTLLRLHFVDGLALEQIALVEQVSRATAGRRLLELRRRLAADTRARLQAALHIDGRELESMVALLQSQLMFSLSAILR